MYKLAIFASGSGTNAENIIKYFQKSTEIRVDIILSNKPDARVLERAKNLNVDYHVFNRDEFFQSTVVLDILKSREIDFIILAGFLWLIPDYLIFQFKNRIINIHPALLPNYGGKGMYGMKVHQQIIENGDKESGISIHFVNEEYDKGKIIFQAKCSIEPTDTAEVLAAKVHALEYRYFPSVIEKVVLNE